MRFVKTFSLIFLLFTTLAFAACGGSGSTSDQSGKPDIGGDPNNPDGTPDNTAKQLIKGVLKDADGNPIANASVFIPSPSDTNKKHLKPTQGSFVELLRTISSILCVHMYR